MSLVDIRSLSKRFGKSTVLSEITCDIREGEIFALIGPSGSGKTTLLGLIDLIDRPTSGEIFFDEIPTDTSEAIRLALRRRMAFVFQKPALLNTTVHENVAAGLKFRGADSTHIRAKVREKLDLVHLSHLSHRMAHTLSGGEMQRMALARALVTEPELLLLDEPTSHLDPGSEMVIEEVLSHMNKEQGTTIIISTHDFIQGQRLAHRAGVLLTGKMAQVGTLKEIFFMPRGDDIASFVGIETILRGSVRERRGDYSVIMSGERRLVVKARAEPGREVVLYIRPEEIALREAASLQENPEITLRNRIPGRITRMIPSGPFTKVRLDCGHDLTLISLIMTRTAEELNLAPGCECLAEISASAISLREV